MSRLIDLTGQRFGRLDVKERVGSDSKGRATWKCCCSCGKEVVVRGDQLRNGTTHSCGCISEKHGGRYTRLYKIWDGMKERCNNPKSTGFEYYGGRGIKICPEWEHDFSTFQEWAYSHGYREYLTIDRIDVNAGYGPDNCRWATWHEQGMNKRPRTQKETHNA